MNSDFVVAVHAMVVLHHKAATLSSEELSQNICTNPVRVRRVMSHLAKAGLVETHRGSKGGGYHYEKTAKVNLRQIAEALDLSLVETGWRSGDEGQDCPIASGMAGYFDGLFGELDEICKARLARITVASIEKTLFKEKGTQS